MSLILKALINIIARTESFVACLTDFKSNLVSCSPFFSLLFEVSSKLLNFLSGDQLGPFKSSNINFSFSLRPAKNFLHPSGRELGSEI